MRVFPFNSDSICAKSDDDFDSDIGIINPYLH